jgi:hypothetical protein
MTRQLLALVVPFAWFALTACKDDTVSKSEWPQTYADQVCEQVVTCNCEYENPTLLDHCTNDLATRQLLVTQSGDEQALTYDAKCADEVLSDLAKLECNAAAAQDDGKCEAPCKTWYGPMGKGATCVSVGNRDNCRQGLVCSSQSVCVNPCEKIPTPEVGEACLLGDCVEGAWCDASDEFNPICRALPKAGEPCQDLMNDNQPNFACANSAYCDEDADPDPICMALPILGESCEASKKCVEGVVCDGETCVELPGLGEACVQGECADEAICNLSADEPVCVVRPPMICNYYGGTPASTVDAISMD